MRRLAGWFAVVALGGCGFGFHANGTVARTAPFHAHPSTIADYPEIPEAPAANLHAPWALVADSFVPYYPNPSAWIVLSEGFSRGTKWGVLQVTPLPETALAQAFRVALGGED
ncbi:MAG: hypothetical protein JNL79_36970, partial [Myxococcales bacterium]|nr:hypothetical protein [Myxococcales bacterium]